MLDKESLIDMKTNETSKKALLNALLNLCKAFNYDEISISQICKESNLNRSTFYRIFKSKDDILKEQLGKFMEEYYSYCVAHKFTDHQNNVYLFSFYRQHGELFMLMYKARLFNELRDICLANFPKNTRHKDDIYEKIYITNGYLGVLLHWLETGMKESDESMAECVSRLRH